MYIFTIIFINQYLCLLKLYFICRRYKLTIMVTAWEQYDEYDFVDFLILMLLV